jgi:hypothetical protein
MRKELGTAPVDTERLDLTEREALSRTRIGIVLPRLMAIQVRHAAVDAGLNLSEFFLDCVTERMSATGVRGASGGRAQRRHTSKEFGRG